MTKQQTSPTLRRLSAVTSGGLSNGELAARLSLLSAGYAMRTIAAQPNQGKTMKIGDHVMFRSRQRCFDGIIIAIDGEMITVKNGIGTRITVKRKEMKRVR